MQLRDIEICLKINNSPTEDTIQARLLPVKREKRPCNFSFNCFLPSLIADFMYHFQCRQVFLPDTV